MPTRTRTETLGTTNRPKTFQKTEQQPKEEPTGQKNLRKTNWATAENRNPKKKIGIFYLRVVVPSPSPEIRPFYRATITKNGASVATIKLIMTPSGEEMINPQIRIMIWFKISLRKS
jgi:hypothetical protein